MDNCDGVTELKPLSSALLDGTNVCDTSGDENISGEVRGDSCAKISSSLSPTGLRVATS